MNQQQNLITAAQNMGMLQIVHVGDTPAKPVAAPAKEEQQTNPNDAYEVGDVLYTSWGYEQTNIDFYQVVSKHGKATLGIREIAGRRESNGSGMTGVTTPVIDEFKDELIKVRIGKYGTASIKGSYTLFPLGYTEVNGQRVYASKSYSSYA